MLVDVLSQYGVGSIYFLAGVFTVHADRQRHPGVGRGGAVGAGVRRHVRDPPHRRGVQVARRRGHDRRGDRPRVRAAAPARRAPPARRHPLRAPDRGAPRCGRRVALGAVRHPRPRPPAADRRPLVRVGAGGLRLHHAHRRRGRRHLDRRPARRERAPRAAPLGSAAGRRLRRRALAAGRRHGRGHRRPPRLGLVPEHAARVPLRAPRRLDL